MTDLPKDPSAAPDAAPSAPVVVKAAPSNRAGAWALFAVIIAGLALLAATLPLTKKPIDAESIAVLNAELEKLKNNPPPVEDTTALQARLSVLESQIAQQVPVGPAPDLSGLQAQNAELQAAVMELQKQLGNLQQKVATGTQSTAQRTLLVAALQLTTAWQQGTTFAAPWQALVSAAESDEELSKWLQDNAAELAPWQEKGVPTVLQLLVEFPATARAELAASAPAGQNFGEKVLSKVQELVVIRKQGETVLASDTALDTQLQKAEQSLKQSDLTAALAALTALTNSTELKDWLARANARAKVDALAQQLVAQSAKYIAAELPTAPVTTP